MERGSCRLLSERARPSCGSRSACPALGSCSDCPRSRHTVLWLRCLAAFRLANAAGDGANRFRMFALRCVTLISSLPLLCLTYIQGRNCKMLQFHFQCSFLFFSIRFKREAAFVFWPFNIVNCAGSGENSACARKIANNFGISKKRSRETNKQ